MTSNDISQQDRVQECVLQWSVLQSIMVWRISVNLIELYWV